MEVVYVTSSLKDNHGQGDSKFLLRGQEKESESRLKI